MTLHLSISDSPDFPGLYAWELRDRGFTASCLAPTINRCLTKLTAARLSIDAHLAAHPHPENAIQTHLPLHPLPIPQVHPPGSAPLPAQQDIPASSTHCESSTSFYLHPSRSG
jgi:hypothetical protein